jgi:hypothetical protein
MLNGSLLTDPGYLDTGVSNYITYYYVITAEDISGFESAFSTEVSASPNPLPPDLVGWWKFDESSGPTAFDSSPGGNNGTINGASWVNDPERGTVLSFDGTDDVVDIIGYKGITGGASRTMCMWIKSADAGGTATNGRGLIGWGEDSGCGVRWELVVNKQSSAGRTVNAPRINISCGARTGQTVLTDSTWHHVAAVLLDDGSPDAQEALLYVDGVAEAYSHSLDEPVDTPAFADVRIGKGILAGSVLNFSGLISDVRIYDKALAPSELEAIIAGD